MQPKLKITGQKELFKKLAKFGEEAEQMVESITQVTAEEIATNAKQNAPVNFGKLKQSIHARKEGHLFHTVYVNNVPIGAYVEFGTGAFVDVPTEWVDMAWQFYVNGKGYLRPQPFLYPAYVRGKAQYEKDLRQLLESLTKKHSK